MSDMTLDERLGRIEEICASMLDSVKDMQRELVILKTAADGDRAQEMPERNSPEHTATTIENFRIKWDGLLDAAERMKWSAGSEESKIAVEAAGLAFARAMDDRFVCLQDAEAADDYAAYRDLNDVYGYRFDGLESADLRTACCAMPWRSPEELQKSKNRIRRAAAAWADAHGRKKPDLKLVDKEESECG